VDRGDEPIAAPWNIDDEPIPITSVTERAAQCGNMYGEVGRLYEYVRPNPIHQFLLCDQLARSFQQSNQYFQSTTSEGHSLVAFQQKKLCWEQAKRSERDFVQRLPGRVGPFFSRHKRGTRDTLTGRLIVIDD
jgi:hypothetical protein